MHLNNSKLVLFDLDGTLVNTAPDFLISINILLKKNNRDPIDLIRYGTLSQMGL